MNIASVVWVCVFIAFFALVVLLIRHRYMGYSRRVGAPQGQATAKFRGGMWLPGKMNTGAGTVRLAFFDWGIRLGSSGLVNLGLGLGKLMMPVWEARYEELTEARLVAAPKQRGVRLRAGDRGDEVIFWTDQGSDVLDLFEQHLVAADRTADQVPEPPPPSVRVGFMPGNTGPS